MFLLMNTGRRAFLEGVGGDSANQPSARAEHTASSRCPAWLYASRSRRFRDPTTAAVCGVSATCKRVASWVWSGPTCAQRAENDLFGTIRNTRWEWRHP